MGKDWERKNGPAVVRAFERLRADIPEARLDLVGGHPPVDSPGVTGHGVMRLDDPVERGRLDQLFSRATCFVMPSLFEPFGLVFAEASAAGVPSIGTTVGGCADLLEGCGRVIDPSDEEALLAAMAELAVPAVAERLGLSARERAKAFTWAEVAGRVIRALEPGGEPATPERAASYTEAHAFRPLKRRNGVLAQGFPSDHLAIRPAGGDAGLPEPVRGLRRVSRRGEPALLPAALRAGAGNQTARGATGSP